MDLKLKEKRNTKQKTEFGFSLLEMLVAVAIFSVVMTISVGALLSIMGGNRKSQALKSTVNNLNFAMENMAKNIRIGTTISCNPGSPISQASDCLSGSDTLAFEPARGNPSTTDDQVVYRYNSTDKSIERSLQGGNAGTFFPLTAPEVKIESLKFYVTGSQIGDGIQPRILIVISGFSELSNATRTDFDLQTTVVTRLLDS